MTQVLPSQFPDHVSLYKPTHIPACHRRYAIPGHIDGIIVDTYPRVRRIVRTEETVLPVDYAYQIDGRIIIAWLCLAETKSIDGTYLIQSTEIKFF